MPKNTRSITHSTFRTILPWLCIVAGLLILAATFSFASWRASHQPPKLASHEDVTRLKEVIADIKTKLEDPNDPWRDTSACTIIKPRLFGDETRYYCRVEYAREYKFVGSQEDMRRAIDEQRKKVAGHLGVRELKSPSYPSYDTTAKDGIVSITDNIGSYAFSVKDVPNANCAVNNVIEPSKGAVILKQNIGCTVNTVGAFGQNIRSV